jgi:hypothetical protein
MYDYEAEHQFSEISGASVTFCDICGMPVSESTYLTSGRGSSPAVADRLLRVCGTCFSEVEEGELEVYADGAGSTDFDGRT